MDRNGAICFTTGEFAALCGVSKHTLFHYDAMGIFSPYLLGENGYRYYSVDQLEVFDVIVILKELDMPLGEIKAYLSQRSPQALVHLLETEEKAIDQRLKKLQTMKELVHQKALLTREAAHLHPGTITLAPLSEAVLVATPAGEPDDRSVAIDISRHVAFCEAHGVLSPYAIGTTEPLAHIRRGEYGRYGCFYTQIHGKAPKGIPLTLRPAGDYLIAYHGGGYYNTGGTFVRMLQFAREQSLQLEGDFYEDVLLDELSAEGQENYLLRIAIRTYKLGKD